MDLSSYAELAVALVNTVPGGHDGDDNVAGLDGLRTLVSRMPRRSTRVTGSDLEALRMLRADMRKVFSAAAAGDGARAAQLLNELLVQHPIHPELSGHDGQRWHLHLNESGTVADQYAAGAVMGLTATAAMGGIDRLGICEVTSCGRVFLDTTSNRSRRYCSASCAHSASATAHRSGRSSDHSR